MDIFVGFAFWNSSKVGKRPEYPFIYLDSLERERDFHGGRVSQEGRVVRFLERNLGRTFS